MSVNLYALVEARPGHVNLWRPFYIGIGTAKRPYTHLRQASSTSGHPNHRLHEVLAAHISAGVKPGIVILSVFASKAPAADAEREAIVRYGRIGIDPEGILCNLACGGAASDPETEARRRANSRAPQKASWANPEIRARRIAAMKGKKKTQSPEALAARRANAQKGRTPEVSAKQSEASRKRWADPEFVEKRRRNQAAAWKDPEKRAKMLAGRSDGVAKSWQNPDIRARRTEAIKARRLKTCSAAKPEGPGRCATMSALNAAKTSSERSVEQATAWDNPDIRARRLDGIRRAAKNPDLAAKRFANMRDGKLRRAAEKAAAEARGSDAVAHADVPDDSA